MTESSAANGGEARTRTVREGLDGGDVIKVRYTGADDVDNYGPVEGHIRKVDPHPAIAYEIETEDGDRIEIRVDGELRSSDAHESDLGYKKATIGTVERISRIDRRGIVVFDPYTEKYYCPGDTCPRCGRGTLKLKDALHTYDDDSDDFLQCSYKYHKIHHHDPEAAAEIFDVEEGDTVTVTYARRHGDEVETESGVVTDVHNGHFAVKTGELPDHDFDPHIAVGRKKRHGKVWGGDWPNGTPKGELQDIEKRGLE